MGNPEETTNKESAGDRSSDETSKKTLKDIEEAQRTPVLLMTIRDLRRHQMVSLMKATKWPKSDRCKTNETRRRGDTETRGRPR